MSLYRTTGWMRVLRPFPPRCTAPGEAGRRFVRQVHEFGSSLRRQPDSHLPQRVETLRAAVGRSPRQTITALHLAEAFALVNESASRELGMEYYDVQLLAGQALAGGTIAEMATGEGKTLVQALAAFAFALDGNGVHVMTSNSYLAQRDHQQLAPVLERLGMSVGLLETGAPFAEKHRAYRADITFGAGYEFGFDYLRDQVALWQRRQPALGESFYQLLRGQGAAEAPMMQRGHACAIVDEADSVMIDEATTPLILSSGPQQMAAGSEAYRAANQVAGQLKRDADFVLNESERRAQLTRHGVDRMVTDHSPPAGAPLERPWLVYVEQALFARHLLRRDVDYVVQSDQIMLVDQSTGRVFADRSLRNGLHQAVEAKEHVPITEARKAMGRISRQQYFQLYRVLCGMTGTARGGQREFWGIYSIPVRPIPTRKTCRREVLPIRFFADKPAKRLSIADQIAQRHAAAQPVLVGTRTIDESRQLTALLDARRIPYQLLNGVQDEEEARIVTAAGQRQAVTIATNIAGRGTDIRLGTGVRELGGLHVIVTEPHESRRVDRQLVGRCARQGDPGSCQMFVSADDEVVSLHAPGLARHIRRRAGRDGEANHDFSRALARVQSKVERLRYRQRRKMLIHDRWMEEIMEKLSK